MRFFANVVLLAFLALLPVPVWAQSLAGVVRDASGAVLPGVTVEAASPALIEKVRSVVTDGGGQYRLIDLTPGTYTVTYTLPGFSTVKRDGVELSGAVTLTLNAELRVGGVQETITVVGETPMVDVQSSTRRQTVLDDSVIASIPASRGYGNLLATVPGIQATGLDVGASVSTNFFTSRGGRGNEGTIQIDGMNVGSAFNGGGVAGYGYDTANAQEIQVTVAGGLGESDRGGPAFNLIPKTGGNTFSGTGFFSTAGKWSQGNNVDDRLEGFGFRRNLKTLVNNYDDNFALGGPILRDRLWFYGNARVYGNVTRVPNAFANLNAGNPALWSYAQDPNTEVRNPSGKRIGAIRLTGQATPKNKLTFYYDYQKVCNGSAFSKGGEQCRDRGDNWIGLGSTAAAPETANVWDDREKIVQAAWTSTATNKLLLEAGLSSFNSRWGGYTPAGARTGLIPVTEQSTLAGVPQPNYTYRGWVSPPSNDQQHNVWRASASYVTGANSMKFGYQAAYQVQKQFQTADSLVSYTFNNGTPISLTQRAAPHSLSNRTRFDAFYVQDQWTRGRVTLQGGLRYEHAWSWHPAGENGIAENQFTSAFLFPEIKGVKGYHDINPRGGVAWDVFGNGKTSIKGTIGQYLQAANNDAQFVIANNAGTFQQTTGRTWADANRNYVADCDLRSSAANGECGAWQNLNVGNPLVTTQVNPDVLKGWGIRPFDMQYGVSVQQQIAPRISAEVNYSKRAWSNFFFTDNRAISPADFDRVSITAPSNANLPGGGGYPVTFLTRNTRTALGATDNYYTFAKDYGDVTAYWHGVDVTVNARTRTGLTLQGGTSTGRGVRNYCDVLDDLPELYVTAGSGFTNWQQGSCAVTEPWITTVRGLASYTIPKIDVLISASARSLANVQPATTNTFVATNGASLAANYVISPALFAQLTGRTLAPGLPNQTVDLNLPGQKYGERVNAVDMRFGKNLRFGRTRTNVALDLYNLFNANTGTAYQQAYDPLTNGAAYLRETTVLSPRFVRFNVTVDF